MFIKKISQLHENSSIHPYPSIFVFKFDISSWLRLACYYQKCEQSLWYVFSLYIFIKRLIIAFNFKRTSNLSSSSCSRIVDTTAFLSVLVYYYTFNNECNFRKMYLTLHTFNYLVILFYLCYAPEFPGQFKCCKDRIFTWQGNISTTCKSLVCIKSSFG